MPDRGFDTRTVTLVDIPFVKRLTGRGTVLDSELGLTRDANGPRSALLSSILLPQRGLHTMVVRSDKQQVVGQFRLKANESNAHIVYIAPDMDGAGEDTAWLHILDAMAREAGRCRANCLIAEVEEDSPLFETMRTAGYAVYARQEIWRRSPGESPVEIEPVELHEPTSADVPDLQSLFFTTVPPLIQLIADPPGDGLVYRKRDRIAGYIAISEGKYGVYIVPYLYPDCMADAPAVIEAAIRQTPRAAKVPVYVCVRRYQSWLEGALFDLRFEPWLQQAVMVKHIAAGVRHATFVSLHRTWEVFGHSPVPPPTKHVTQPWIGVQERV